MRNQEDVQGRKNQHHHVIYSTHCHHQFQFCCCCCYYSFFISHLTMLFPPNNTKRKYNIDIYKLLFYFSTIFTFTSYSSLIAKYYKQNHPHPSLRCDSLSQTIFHFSSSSVCGAQCNVTVIKAIFSSVMNYCFIRRCYGGEKTFQDNMREMLEMPRHLMPYCRADKLILSTEESKRRVRLELLRKEELRGNVTKRIH